MDINTKCLFLHLLLSANIEDRFFNGIIVKRGQTFVGRHELSRILGISEQGIRTSIKKLKSTNEITTETTNKGTLITIVNFDKYQYSSEEVTNEITNNSTTNQPTSNQQVTINQPQYKKDKNKKEIKRIKALKDIVEFDQISEAIVQFLNETLGTRYHASTKETKELIHGRLNEGRTLEDFKLVIQNRFDKWSKDPEMKEYLRPSTLFRPTNFENYLNDALVTAKQSTSDEESNTAKPNENKYDFSEFNVVQEGAGWNE